MQQRRIVDRELGPHGELRASRALREPQHEERTGRRFRGQQPVAIEIFGGSGRALLLQVRRRRAEDGGGCAEHPDDRLRGAAAETALDGRRRIGERIGAQHEVVACRRRGAADLTEFDLERDLRVAFEEARHERREQHPSIGRISQHPQGTVMLGREHRSALTDLLGGLKDRAALRQQLLARRRQRQPTRGARHQRQAEFCLQLGDRPADARLGHLERPRSRGETVQIDHLGEDRHAGGSPHLRHR